MKYVYNYPRPMVTVDMALLRYHQSKIEILLIQRDRSPFMGRWALPGGFIEMEETLLESACRELEEETGLKNIHLFPLFPQGDPGRDPRGRTITLVYGGIVTPPFPEISAGDDARNAQWFSIESLLAFDHDNIIKKTIEIIQSQAFWNVKFLEFFPEQFDLDDLKKLSNILFSDNAYTSPLLKIATTLDLIQEKEAGKFEKTEKGLLVKDLSFKKISKQWIDLINKID